MLIQYQIVIPENIQTGSIIQTEKVIFRNTYIHICIYILIIDIYVGTTMEAMNRRTSIWEGLERRKGQGK